ncbi:MAG: sulfatase-like hydrolase/transferase [Rikenellaceae bacterium]
MKKTTIPSTLKYVAPIFLLSGVVSCETAEPTDQTTEETEDYEDVEIPNSHPNIILMLADDMGFDDMSYRGNTSVNTPNLDELATNSTRFENFYVHSVSAPTRASLLTGRHFLRTGVSGLHAGRDFMNLDEVTIAEALSDAGYKTGMWGKWHSGKSNGYYPWQRGFDEAYMASLYHHEDNSGDYYGTYNGTFYSGSTLNLDGRTDSLMVNMAINFMSDNRSEKFFAYIPFLTPHADWSAPEEDIEPYRKMGQSENFATLNGMLTHLDRQVGRVVAAVEELGIADNTIIIFMSDNGPNKSGVDSEELTDAEWTLRNPSGLKGNKSKNLENGIKSPLFVYWKGRIESYDNRSLLSVCDLFPTLCDVAGATIPTSCKALDGESFYNLFTSPYLNDQSRTLYISHWSPFFADEYIDDDTDFDKMVLTEEAIESIDPELQHIGIRKGDYKFLLNEYGESSYALWNIANDPTESKNLSGTSDSYTSKALAYKSELTAWYEDILADDGSLTIPTFQIGYEDYTDFSILAYAPIAISSGLVNESSQLSGFDTAGEYATYGVEIVREARYYLRLKMSSGTYVDDLEFAIGTNLDSYLGDVTWNSGSATSKLLALDLTSDITTITVTLKSDRDVSLTLKEITLEYKSDL